MATAAFVHNAVSVTGVAEPGARFRAFAWNTTTPVVVYADSALTVPAAHPDPADAAGHIRVYFDNDNDYSFQVKSADDADTLLEVDYKNGLFSITYADAGNFNSLQDAISDFLAELKAAGVDASWLAPLAAPYIEPQPLDALLTAIGGLTVSAGDVVEATGADTFRARKLQVATYAALTAVPAASRFDDMIVFVASRATDGDGGEGHWRFDASSSATANGGTVLAPDAGTGRWHRIYTGDIRPEWFGARTGAADNSGALNAAFALGEPVRLGGFYAVTDAVGASAVPVTISGAGPAVAGIILNHADAQILLEPNAQGVNTPPQKVCLTGFQVKVGTGVALTNPALEMVWSAYQPTAEKSLHMSDVHVTRADNGTGTAPAYLRIEKCSIGIITDCNLLGDDNFDSAKGVEFIDCIGMRFVTTDVNRFALGMDLSVADAVQTEGVFITDCNIYDVEQGINVDDAIHFNVRGTHINIRGSGASCCINMGDVEQHDIRACLFYVGGEGGDAANQDGIRVTAETGQGIISGNTFVGLNSNARDGIRAVSGFTLNLIDGNTFISFSGFAINLPSGANTNFVIGNKLVSCTISNASTSQVYATDVSGTLSNIHPRWGTGDGSFAVGEISCTADWGCYIKGRVGGAADVVLASSGGVNVVRVFTAGDGTIKLPTSATGLASGEIWNNSGTVTVVP